MPMGFTERGGVGGVTQKPTAAGYTGKLCVGPGSNRDRIFSAACIAAYAAHLLALQSVLPIELPAHSPVFPGCPQSVPAVSDYFTRYAPFCGSRIVLECLERDPFFVSPSGTALWQIESMLKG